MRRYMQHTGAYLKAEAWAKQADKTDAVGFRFLLPEVSLAKAFGFGRRMQHEQKLYGSLDGLLEAVFGSERSVLLLVSNTSEWDLPQGKWIP